MTSLPLDLLCRQLPACIIFRDHQRMILAVTSRPSAEIIETLCFASQCQVEFEFWPEARIESHLRNQTSHLTQEVPEDEAPAVPQIASQLLHLAVRQRASDIHLEQTLQGTVIRLRIDGLLQPTSLSGSCTAQALIARFKILAGLDIAESRLPQDGQLSLEINGENHSFRLSTLPTRLGEKLVLRRLQLLPATLDPQQLGLSEHDLRQVLDVLNQPQGMILVTGPTGSGKTFTLYSLLNKLNSSDKNLSSVEDPVEMPLNGINQSQINSKAGLDFARILRALLRQDPDVIMIGEIRDNETAEIAVKAAQTGHLVLSTLHTNSTHETLIRLRQMGIAGYLLAASLKLVIAQRLVRKLCYHCRRVSATEITLPASFGEPGLTHWLPVGCDHCLSGYYGRIALFEILTVQGELHQAIARDASAEELKAITIHQGMQTLFVAGLNAVREGQTSWAEVVRITGGPGGSFNIV